MRFAPVIVLAPARSYTSVVTSMIGQHPELYGFPELILFAHRTIKSVMGDESLADARQRSYHQAGLIRAVAEVIIGEQTGDGVAKARRWLERRNGWSTIALFDVLQEHVAPLAAVEKSPDTSGSDVAIFRILIAYPRARFIHLARHPTTAIKSMCAHWRQLKLDSPETPLEVTCASVWYTSHARIRTITDEFAADRTLTLLAEKLLATPARELHAVARWLGIRSDEAAIEAMLHPETSPYAAFGPHNARGGNDPAFLSNPRPRVVELPKSRDLPEEWAIGERSREAISKLAVQLGY